MTRLALGAKCGRPGKPEEIGADARESSASNPASAATPIPPAVRLKKCRRVCNRACCCQGCMDYSLVMTSSRFNTKLATFVKAAISVLSSDEEHFASP